MIWRGWGLLLCAACCRAQSPTPEQTSAAIEKTRQVALAYVHSLPDFVCTQLVHRFFDLTHYGYWRSLDILTIKLSYSNQQEDHKLVLVNGSPPTKSYDDMIGAVTEGEFGMTLEQIFDPRSQAVFTWDKWTKVGKRHAAVYQFQVAAAHSRYDLAYREYSEMTRVHVGFRGEVELDRETGEVLRLTYAATEIPRTYPIRVSKTSVVYAGAEVGGRPYLLPTSSETEMQSAEMWARNQTTFREYRKFEADSTITFGAGK